MRVRAIACSLTVLLTLAGPASAKPGGKGTDVLHLTSRAGLVPTGVAPDAMGEVTLSLRQQGNADIQKVALEITGLAPETTYHLFALLRGAADFTEVGAFDTDADGAADMKWMKGGVPMELDPVVDVLALEVRSGADETVLEADLTDPDFLQYLVKRKLGNDGVDDDASGSLMLKSNGGAPKLRLLAIDLDPEADYTLVMNGAAVATLTTDANGRLQTQDYPAGGPDVLDLESVELRDGSDASVLSTQLP